MYPQQKGMFLYANYIIAKQYYSISHDKIFIVLYVYILNYETNLFIRKNAIYEIKKITCTTIYQYIRGTLGKHFINGT